MTSQSTLGRQRLISTYGYTQAKSLVYSKHGEPKDVLSLHTHSISPPHSNLLTLRTLATPLNPADINQIQGTYPSLPPFTSTLGTPQPSAVPGNEGCFEVLSTGSGIKSDIKKGDWVIAKYTGLGTWRTHLQIEEDKVLKVEKQGLRPEQVATVGVNPVTAWRMLTDFIHLDGKAGDWFIQNGANSGVGRAAIQLGRQWQIHNIAVIRNRQDKSQEASLKQELETLGNGFTHVVTEEAALDRSFDSTVQDLIKREGKSSSGGNPQSVKLALNCVGGKPATSLARILFPGAQMVTYGAMSKQPLTLPAGLLIFKNITFSGFWVSKWADAHPEEKEKTVKDVLDLMREGQFTDGPVEKREWGWGTSGDDLVQAVQGTLEGYRRGKGVFVFPPGEG